MNILSSTTKISKKSVKRRCKVVPGRSVDVSIQFPFPCAKPHSRKLLREVKETRKKPVVLSKTCSTSTLFVHALQILRLRCDEPNYFPEDRLWGLVREDVRLEASWNSSRVFYRLIRFVYIHCVAHRLRDSNSFGKGLSLRVRTLRRSPPASPRRWWSARRRGTRCCSRCSARRSAGS